MVDKRSTSYQVFQRIDEEEITESEHQQPAPSAAKVTGQTSESHASQSGQRIDLEPDPASESSLQVQTENIHVGVPLTTQSAHLSCGVCRPSGPGASSEKAQGKGKGGRGTCSLEKT